MRIIKLVNQPNYGPQDLLAIISEMINLEGSSTIMDEYMNKILEPKPYPSIIIKNSTTKGLPYSVHYQPTTGIIYYTAHRNILGFIDLIMSTMNEYGTDHFPPNTLSSATYSTGLERMGSREDSKRTHSISLIDSDLPCPYTISSGFHWYFMPISTIILAENLPFCLDKTNAIVSSILVDFIGSTSLVNGSIAMDMKLSYFRIPSPVIPKPNLSYTYLVDPVAGRTYLVGKISALFCKKNNIHSLDKFPHDPTGIDWTRPCINCHSPIGDLCTIFLYGQITALMCKWCWESADINPPMVDIQTYKIISPYTQSRILSGKYLQSTIDILDGIPSRINTSEPMGAFVITKPCGSKFIIACERLGAHPELTNVIIAEMGLPVIPMLKIAECI